MSEILERRLSKAQLQLLALFQQAPDVPETVWEEMRASVSRYLIEKLGEEAGEFTDAQEWDEADFHRLARTRMRNSE